MNVEALDTIAQWLEAGGDGEVVEHNALHFNYNWYWMNVLSIGPEDRPDTGCNTVCCIAGAATVLMKKEGIHASGSLAEIANGFSKTEIASYLGLDAETSSDLFFGAFNHDRFRGLGNSPTSSEAAQCIRRLMITGVTDWPATREMVDD